MEIALTIFFLTLVMCCFILIRKINNLQQSITRIEAHLSKNPDKVESIQQIAEIKIPEAIPLSAPDTPPLPDTAAENKTPTLWKRFINWLLVSGEYYSDNVSVEYTAATAWLIRAGVFILICAVGFMLKYSFDHNLFSPALRISFMAVLGTVLAAAGFILTRENKFHRLFTAICGIGFATVFLSIFAGFRIYGLFSVTVASVAVFVVMALCMAAAWKKSSQFLAAVGAIGIYAAPWLIVYGNSEAYWKVLLYFAIAGSGLSLLSAVKNWIFLRILLVAGYSLWSLGCVYELNSPALLLISLYFINLLVAGIPYFLRREMSKADYMLWIISTGVFLILALGCAFSSKWCSDYKIPSMIALVTAIVNGILFKLNERQKGSAAFAVLAIASVALACGLLGMKLWLTAMWSILALALAVAACRTETKYLAVMSILLFIAAIFTFPDTTFLRGYYFTRLLHNVFSYGIYSVTLLIAAVLFKRNEAKLKLEPCPWFMLAFSMIFIFAYTTYEIYCALAKFIPEFKLLGISVAWSVAAAILIEIGINTQKAFLRKTGAVLFVLSCLKVMLFDLAESNTLWRIGVFGAVGILLLASAVIYIRKRDIFRTDNSKEK